MLRAGWDRGRVAVALSAACVAGMLGATEAAAAPQVAVPRSRAAWHKSGQRVHTRAAVELQHDPRRVRCQALIDALTGCPGSNSLLWFNPGTRAEQWLFKAPPNALGVLAVAAAYSNLNSSL